MCVIALKLYGRDVRNTTTTNPKMVRKQPFFYNFRISQKLSIRFKRSFLQSFYIILESYMCNGVKIVWLRCETHSQTNLQIVGKQTLFDFFRISQKLSKRVERNSLQSFYTILESYMCNSIKTVRLGCDRLSKN